MGICFVGKVGIKEFLSQYVETVPGEIIDQNHKVIGEHDGAIFYTIGQRHGLDVGGGLPYYVTGKDMKQNKVYVTSDINDKRLWLNEINITNCHWIKNQPQYKKVEIRTRHRAKLITCELNITDIKNAKLIPTEPIRAITPGQSAVVYYENECLGGGIIV
jgi:tRNA-specific 2-thiouridylase